MWVNVWVDMSVGGWVDEWMAHTHILLMAAALLSIHIVIQSK